MIRHYGSDVSEKHKKTQLFAEFITYGGAKEDRTPDPLLAKQVLSQLSYNPMYINSMKWWA